MMVPVPPYAAQENASLQENYYNDEDKVQIRTAGYQPYPGKEAPYEREVWIYTSTNYATDQPHEVLFNFPPNYDPDDAPKRLGSVFDRLSSR